MSQFVAQLIIQRLNWACKHCRWIVCDYARQLKDENLLVRYIDSISLVTSFRFFFLVTGKFFWTFFLLRLLIGSSSGKRIWNHVWLNYRWTAACTEAGLDVCCKVSPFSRLNTNSFAPCTFANIKLFLLLSDDVVNVLPTSHFATCCCCPVFSLEQTFPI